MWVGPRIVGGTCGLDSIPRQVEALSRQQFPRAHLQDSRVVFAPLQTPSHSLLFFFFKGFYF
jgi:hypothetical protein